MNFTWTREQTEQLQALLTKGLSYTEIAKQMGGAITKHAISSKIRRLDTSKNPWNEERIARLKELWAHDWICEDIAKELGTTKNAIACKAHRIKLERRTFSDSGRGAVLRNADTRSYMIHFMNLTQESCRWPMAEPGMGHEESVNALRFCGRQRNGNKPYCPEHCARAYIGAVAAV